MRLGCVLGKLVSVPSLFAYFYFRLALSRVLSVLRSSTRRRDVVEIVKLIISRKYK